jgi:hypothetical protein
MSWGDGDANLQEAQAAEPHISSSNDESTDDTDEHDEPTATAAQTNGTQAAVNGDDAELADAEGDDSMDDDMMDKISSSPSIDDGGSFSSSPSFQSQHLLITICRRTASFSYFLMAGSAKSSRPRRREGFCATSSSSSTSSG